MRCSEKNSEELLCECLAWCNKVICRHSNPIKPVTQTPLSALRRKNDASEPLFVANATYKAHTCLLIPSLSSPLTPNCFRIVERVSLQCQEVYVFESFRKCEGA